MHEPTKKRLRKHLSAAINFSKFVEWKEEFEQQLDDAADEANARNLQMQAKVEARRLELAEVMEEKQRKAQVCSPGPPQMPCSASPGLAGSRPTAAGGLAPRGLWGQHRL